MRYEAKHQFLKDLIRKLKNFHDVSFLFASGNQLHIIYHAEELTGDNSFIILLLYKRTTPFSFGTASRENY